MKRSHTNSSHHPPKACRDRAPMRFSAERLECRTLLSAWSTVDTLQLGSGISNNQAMVADGAGNVYAAGVSPSQGNHGIVREASTVNGITSWTTIENLASAAFRAAAMDSAGNLYVGGAVGSSGQWAVLERAAGSNTFITVDRLTVSSSCAAGLATDAAGDVFAVGDSVEGGYEHWIVRERIAGKSTFSTVDDVANGQLNLTASGITVIGSGPSAGVYVVGDSTDNGQNDWLVRKSPTGAAGTWSTVDHPLGQGGASAVAGDANGNVYVVGNLVENSSYHWMVRKSANGGATWSTSDDFQIAPGLTGMAYAVGSDLAGNIYVAGKAQSSSSTTQAIIRSNSGGSWQTVDSFSPIGGGLGYRSFTVDSTGNLYAGGAMVLTAGGGNSWFTRSSAGPGSGTATAAAAVFSSTRITSANDPTDIFHHRRHRA